MSLDPSKTCVLITGASRGIGAATAKLFWKMGYKVAITARHEHDLLSQAKLIAPADSGRLLPLQGDMSHAEDVERVFQYTQKQLGPVDILINNAASLEVAEIATCTLESFQNTIKNNVDSVFLCSQKLFLQQQTCTQRHAKMILNITSLGGMMFTPKFAGLSAYVASKFAVTGLTEALAEEGRTLNITVMALAPGAVETKMLRKAAPHLMTSTHPDDVAKVIVGLCTTPSLYPLSGCILPWNTNL